MSDLQWFIISLILVGAVVYQMDMVRRYKNLLLMLARLESAEKLTDGNFYYIVPESKYNELIRKALNHDNQTTNL